VVEMSGGLRNRWLETSQTTKELGCVQRARRVPSAITVQVER
jgi:hypothetical protein